MFGFSLCYAALFAALSIPEWRIFKSACWCNIRNVVGKPISKSWRSKTWNDSERQDATKLCRRVASAVPSDGYAVTGVTTSYALYSFCSVTESFIWRMKLRRCDDCVSMSYYDQILRSDLKLLQLFYYAKSYADALSQVTSLYSYLTPGVTGNLDAFIWSILNHMKWEF